MQMNKITIKAALQENAGLSFFIDFFDLPRIFSRIDFVKYLMSQLTPIPPTMQAAGAITNSNLTITDEK